MPEITLDDNHIYRVGGQPCEGVTEIIKEAGLMPIYNGDKYYLDRGSYVHEAIALYFKGTLDFEALSEGIKGFVESAIEYITLTGYKPSLVETMLYSPTFHYCGTVDAVPLLDWKNSNNQKWHSLQIAAYWNLLMENKVAFERPITVHLREDGKLPKVESYTLMQIREGLGIFTSALAIYRWRKEHVQL